MCTEARITYTCSGCFPVADTMDFFLQEELNEGPDGVCCKVFEAMGVDATFIPETLRRFNSAAMLRILLVAALLSTRGPVSPGLSALAPQVGIRTVRRLKSRLRALN